MAKSEYGPAATAPFQLPQYRFGITEGRPFNVTQFRQPLRESCDPARSQIQDHPVNRIDGHPLRIVHVHERLHPVPVWLALPILATGHHAFIPVDHRSFVSVMPVRDEERLVFKRTGHVVYHGSVRHTPEPVSNAVLACKCK